MYTGLRADDFQDLPQRESNAEAADEHPRLCRSVRTRTSELGEHFFRLRGIGAHERLAVRTQVKVRVMRMQREFRTIGRAGGGEKLEGLRQNVVGDTITRALTRGSCTDRRHPR